MSEPITLGTEGHFGCPDCGHPEFTCTKGVTSVGVQDVTCTYDTGQRDPDAFEIIDYGDARYEDADQGDLECERRCAHCGEPHHTPTWHPDMPAAEEFADVIGLELNDMHACKPVAAVLQHAGAVHVGEEAHATVISVSPRTASRGHGRDRWVLDLCTRCGGDMTTRHQHVEPLRANRAPVLDGRHLPVLLVTQRCATCV